MRGAKGGQLEGEERRGCREQEQAAARKSREEPSNGLAGAVVSRCLLLQRK